MRDLSSGCAEGPPMCWRWVAAEADVVGPLPGLTTCASGGLLRSPGLAGEWWYSLKALSDESFTRETKMKYWAKIESEIKACPLQVYDREKVTQISFWNFYPKVNHSFLLEVATLTPFYSVGIECVSRINRELLLNLKRTMVDWTFFKN